MDRQGEGQPLTELRLGKFRKENLKYRLTDDPTAVHKLHGEAQDSSIVTPEERAIAEKVDYGIAFLKETLVFVLFLGCFVAAVFISSPPFEYDSVSSLRQIFVSPSSGQKFLSIVGSNDARAWLEGVLVPGLYAEKDGAGRDKGSYDRQFIRGGNRLIGPVRVRQVRSKGGCHVAWFGRTLRIPSSDCVGTPNDVNRMEDTRPFGSEYRVNGQGGYSLKEIDSLRALGFAANITAVPRFRYWTHDELCSEAHDPARETDMTVDSNARTVAKSNEGLRTFCMSGLGTTGELGVVYPQGGYVLDLPPTKWVAALRQYRIDKLLAASEWARKHGPFGSFVPRSRTATVSQTLVPPPPDAPLDEVNVTETAYTAAFENATLTQVTGSATVRPEATATLTSISLEFPKMPSRAEYSTAALHEMFEHQWIDNKTSMVSTEFTVYNANTNIVIASRFVLEFLATGQVLPSFRVRALLLPTNETPQEKFLLATELIIVLFIFYYLVQEGCKIYAFFTTNWRHCQVCVKRKITMEHLAKVIVCPNCHRHFNPFILPCCPDCYVDVHTGHQCWRGYFMNLWNIIDIVNLSIFITVFTIRFKLRADVGKMVFQTETRFVQMFSLAELNSLANILNAVNVVLSFLKTIKYLGRVKVLSGLIATLKFAAVPTVWFFFVFGVIYVGFSIAFFAAFSADTYQYRDQRASMSTLFRMVLYQFEFEALEDANPIIGSILFFIFNTLMVLIMSNIFISIVDESYQKARIEVKEGRLDYLNSSLMHLTGRIVKTFQKMLGHYSDNVEKFRTLGRNIHSVPALTADQKDDVRNTVKEIVERGERELMHDILLLFHFDVTRVMRADDYDLLKSRIAEHKQEKLDLLAATFGKEVFWENDEEATEEKVVLTTADKDRLKNLANQRRRSMHADAQQAVTSEKLTVNIDRTWRSLDALAASGCYPRLDLSKWVTCDAFGTEKPFNLGEFGDIQASESSSDS